MADVVGGGTGNVTLYDESGNQFGTPAHPLSARIGDSSGNSLALLNANPTGSEYGLPIRNVSPFQTVRAPEESRARVGQAYTAGTGQLSLTVAATVRGTLQNPSGSGKALYVYKLSIFSSGATGFARMRINPTTGLPTEVRSANNNFIGHPTAAVGVMKADLHSSEGLGGGTDSGIELAFPSGESRDVTLSPFIVSPGITLGLSVPFAGSTTVIVNLYWWEE